MVGRVTLVTLVTGLPVSSSSLNVTVSGPGTGRKSGAAPGQIGIWWAGRRLSGIVQRCFTANRNNNEESKD